MITALKKPPRYQLRVEDCEHIFKAFSRELIFDEPIPPFRTRPKGKLESILFSVNQTFGRKRLNPTLLDTVVALFYQLIKGHPFINGNKRLAVVYTHVYLLINGVDIKLSYRELYEFALFVAINSKNGDKSDLVKKACRNIFSEYSVSRIPKTIK